MTAIRSGPGLAETVPDLVVGRDPVPGIYAFAARYLVMPWHSCLDVGGGLGIGRRILLKRTQRVRSIDVDPRLVGNGVETGRIEDEPDAAYDWGLAVDVVEHVVDDLGFVRHLARVARRGVVLSTPNLAHHPERAWPYHVREYRPAEFRTLVESAASGRDIVHMGGDTYGGNLSIRNLTEEWEHQCIVCFKRKPFLTGAILALRERARQLRASG